MNSFGKIVNLCLFTLFFIPALFAEPLPDDENPPPDNAVNAENEETNLGEAPSFDDDWTFDDDSFVFDGRALVVEVPVFTMRSFNEIFPNLTPRQKSSAMSNMGIRHSFEKDESPTLIPDPDSGIELLSGVMSKKPSHIIEALLLVPYKKRELDLLDIYNALRRIKNIQDFTITSRGVEYKMFKDTSRIESAQKRKPIPDPPPAETLPYSETIYLRFVDQVMGDLYLRGDISVSLYGLTYSLTNFRDVSYSIFRIMKAERFTAVIYLEPVKEGILIYSMSGLYIPGFISNRVNLTPSMNYRITVLINWITDGLRKEENTPKSNHFYHLRQE